MRMWMTYPMTIIDTIFKALAPAIPDRIIAGHHADLVVARVNGRRPKDDGFYIYLGGLIGGGWGAKHDSDGRNATIAMNDGDTHNGPSEQVEAKYPLLVERYALRPDSGGAGRFRGGLGFRCLQHRNAARHRRAEFPQQRLGLILMDVHLDVLRPLSGEISGSPHYSLWHTIYQQARKSGDSPIAKPHVA